MGTRAALMTQTAVHAQVLADTFRAAFAASKLPDHTVVMSFPTQSTEGGRSRCSTSRSTPRAGCRSSSAA